jgi:hypothetical protein
MLLFVVMSKKFMRRLNNFCPNTFFAPKIGTCEPKTNFYAVTFKIVAIVSTRIPTGEFTRGLGDLAGIKVRFLNNY